MTHTQTQGADGAGTFDHEFKSAPSVFYPAARGEKAFEYRRDDRGGYEVGQTVRLRCYDAGSATYLPEPPLDRRITNILRGGEFELPQGYCILSLAPLADGAGTKTAGERAHEAFYAGIWRPEWCRLSADTHQRWEAAAKAMQEASTPDPAATPGVPDSVRALSEKIKSATLYARKGGFTRSTLFLTDEESNCILAALITTHPAAQNAATGAGPCEDDITSAMIQAGRYAANLNDGTLARIYLAMRTVEWEEVRKPGPDSTRTGAAESQPDELTETEIRARAAALISAKGWAPGETLHFKAVLDLMTEHGMAVASNPPQDRCAHPRCGCDADSVCGAALAARPEAPSDAGWSREDLEAFVAREWPEGRSAGAAARELVRALGARGLAPTLQRLLTDLLGQINFASTDRAQILADFANAAPEAARMAKIDSFERWNPRVFDPTPPSDPAPSGQAEG